MKHTIVILLVILFFFVIGGVRERILIWDWLKDQPIVIGLIVAFFLFTITQLIFF